MNEIEIMLFSGVIFGLFYLSICLLLSREIFLWEPFPIKRISLIIAVWLLPLVVAFIAYRRLNLDWFKFKRKTTPNPQSGISSGLLEIDTIFNPGQRHVIEQKQKENIDLTQDIGDERVNKIL